MRSWLRFGGQLLQKSSLPGVDREVVILRAAARCGSDYEWGQHVGIGRLEGLDDATMLRCGALDALGGPPAAAGDWVGVLLAATDELVVDHCVSDPTWRALSARYDTSQLIELTMLAGHYAMVAGMLRSAGVQTESPMPRVGEV
jgi:alkylhydroperoxidase family enzyme